MEKEKPIGKGTDLCYNKERFSERFVERGLLYEDYI